MAVGFIMLVHGRLDRAGALARFLADQNADVVIHLDRRMRHRARALADETGVQVISTRRSEWGMFALVQATLDAAELLLRRRPDLGHICLISGACLPLRSVAAMNAFLARHPDTDFIENMPVQEKRWVQDGLEEERFTLYFPLPWRRHRWLFDRLVDVQRALGVCRRMPLGMIPRLGLQWWCLTRASLEAVLNHPQRRRFDRFFRYCWIPDESYFQSLVPMLAKGQVMSRPLCLQQFEARGIPLVFTDDHAEILADCDYFFARKIDPDSETLYSRFLSHRPDHDAPVALHPAPIAIKPTAQTHGLVSQSYMPLLRHGYTTPRPYVVLLGWDGALLAQLAQHMRACNRAIAMHGRLFGPRPAQFSTPTPFYRGNLPADPRLRDYQPEQFLQRLIWMDGDRKTAFLFHPVDNARIAQMLLRDAHARLILLSDQDSAGQMIDLMRRGPSGRVRDIKAAMHRLCPYTLQRAIFSGDQTAMKGLECLMADDWSDRQNWTYGTEYGGILTQRCMQRRKNHAIS